MDWKGSCATLPSRFETLKRPALEEAIRTLRAELGDIGRALNEALPRHAIETLEMQIQVLAQRIAEGREAGADGGALIGIENGLAEVRDALRDLMPAENLVGYNEAIETLTQKIDLIVAERNPATMQQLERSLATLREMSAHVASNDTVSRLSAQVQTLAEKIDRLAVGPRSEVKLDNLASRIDALTRALAERTQVEIAAPQRLEALIQTLSEKIEQLQKSGAGNIAADHLENRIVKLMERIDASDSRVLTSLTQSSAASPISWCTSKNCAQTENRRPSARKGPVSIRSRRILSTPGNRWTPCTDGWAIFSIGLQSSKREFTRAEADKPATPKPETAQGDNFQFALPAHLVSAELPIAAELPIETSIVPETPAPANSLLPDAATTANSRRASRLKSYRDAGTRRHRIAPGSTARARVRAAAPRSAEFADCGLGGRTRRSATGCGGFRQQGEFHCGGSPGGPGRGPGARRPHLARRRPQCLR